MADPTLQVALIQHACGEDREANLNATEAGLREAAAAGARLALLQELHTGAYFCKSEETARFEMAEPIPGPTTERLGRIAAELKLVIVASLFERRAAGLYHNTAVVLESDGRIAGRYRKMHIPDDPGYYEKFYFTPGDLGFTPIDTSGAGRGVLVGWVQWCPEEAGVMGRAGAERLLHPTAIGWDNHDRAEGRQRQREAWVTVQRGHAVANGLPLLACNRVGAEPDPTGGPDVHFWGSSFVVGPQGEFIAQAPEDQPAVLMARVDMARSEAVRRIWPFLRDRRIDAYGDLLRRYRD